MTAIPHPDLPHPLGAPAPVAAGSMAGVIDALLRDRSSFLAALADRRRHADLARALTLTVLASGAVLGAVLGLVRGGLQIPYAALKLPLVVLFTAALSAPALSALRQVADGSADRRQDLLIVLGALALGTLLAAALSPLLLLATIFDVQYHDLVLLTVALCAVSGAGGLGLLLRGLRAAMRGRQRLVGVAFVAIFCLVGARMSWTLRPWLVRPRTPEVVFVRGIEGSFFGAVLGTQATASGRLSREQAPTERVVPAPALRPRPGSTILGGFR
ncbi:MAG: hypothetical protein H6746_02730 [Deltaproteobacteria bacterium]|nr:hypothetical protein [Deltaproteobacteria bacterium]